MSGIRDHLRSRMVPRDEKDNLERVYVLGEWEFDDIDTGQKIETINFDTYEAELYYRYISGQYCEYQELYERIYIIADKIARKWPDPSPDLIWDQVELLMEKADYRWPNKDDDDFVTHLENQLDSANPNETVKDFSEDAAELWIRYLLDRGANESVDANLSLED